MAAHKKPFDVVIVPDFSGTKADIYEKRTLLFLVSWLLNSGRAVSFPLHVACIGEPSASVRAVAKKCNASITVHAPLIKGDLLTESGHSATCNKLRGLEISGRTDRVLLLDADTVIFSDPSEVSAIENGIAAAPDTFPRIPDDYWVKICRAINIKLPEKVIPTLSQRNGIFRPNNFHRTLYDSLSSNFSYYNSGAVFIPWNYRFREIWEDHLLRIATLFNNNDRYWRDVIFDDQAGFATAVEMLSQQGASVVSLPEQFNARPYHIFMKALQVQEVKVFHATQIFSGDYRIKKIFPLKRPLPISHYKYNLLFRYFELIAANMRIGNRVFDFPSILHVIKQISAIGNRLKEIYKKQHELLGSLD